MHKVMRVFVGLLTLSGLLSGCVTVQNSKALTVHATDAPITVTSTARVRFGLYAEVRRVG
jgi:hypothetical protein